MDKLNCMQLRAPAKINLSFRIRRRRADGFHEIETLMAPISLCDELTIERTDKSGIHFQCNDPSLSEGPDNLVVQAAELFFRTTGQKPAVDIALEKRIPHGAGLGGGSSDAATTLLGLNKLFSTNLPRAELGQLAAQIGADVPFFIYESAAVCSGRGEIVAPKKLKIPLSLFLVKPAFGVPTPWAYSRWQDSRELPGVLDGAQELDGAPLVNDLERPVFEKFIFLAQTKMWLRRQPEVAVALLSGSGSTIFSVLHAAAASATLANRARAELDPELWTLACMTL